MKQNNTEFTEDTITLYLDNDQEVECDILAIFPIKDQFYIALMPQSPVDGYDEGEYFLYRYASDGDHAEWEAVEDKFEELLDEDEFNNMSE